MLEKIIILDFGSQTTQLIARRLRELKVYCEIFPYNRFPNDDEQVIGVILSGSPFSVNDSEAFKPDLSSIRGKYPLLGICYGTQYLAYSCGGTIEKGDSREYGRARLNLVDRNDRLMANIRDNSQVWMSHGDTITVIPHEFHIIAQTEDVQAAAFHIENEQTWGVQFHPEVYHTEIGMALLDNFLQICGAKRDWTPASFIQDTIEKLKKQLGNDNVILALSGGVDSSVCAVLLNRAIGKNLTCIFVDHGLLRKNEYESVLESYKQLGLNVLGIDAKDFFYKALEGEDDPEKKRKIIGKAFIDIFNREAQKLQNIQWLGDRKSVV